MKQMRQKLTELLRATMAASTSSSEENVTNPNPVDLEVPGTLETLALKTFSFSENKLSSISLVTLFARDSLHTLCKDYPQKLILQTEAVTNQERTMMIIL